jgi:hypothetical protein
MRSIPIDVLREILEHVRKADLATLCRVNKICCSCSQDVLYRKIVGDEIVGDQHVIQMLAQSTDLARRVHSFHSYSEHPELSMALRNMSSLRRLNLEHISEASILDGCTFKLDSFVTTFPSSESLQKFLNSQPSLTSVTIWGDYNALPPFDEKCLPNLTRVAALPSWLGILIPGRPVREVMVVGPRHGDSIDFSIFTPSTAPIRKLQIDYQVLYPTPGSHLASIFPSLEYLVVEVYGMNWAVRIPPLYLSI